MLEHQPLHLAVVATAPIGARQERPADLDFAPLPIVTVEPRRPDDPALLCLAGHQCTPRSQRLAEEDPELIFFVAVVIGMLLPDERVSSDREKLVEIGGSKRPQFKELTCQHWLQIEVHDIQIMDQPRRRPKQVLNLADTTAQ